MRTDQKRIKEEGKNWREGWASTEYFMLLFAMGFVRILSLALVSVLLVKEDLSNSVEGLDNETSFFLSFGNASN